MQQESEAEARLDQLQTRVGLVFKRRELLREAMTHTSWINERGDVGRDNERLEYLGDAVLELVAGEYLFSRFPNYDEGQLTQMRSSLVSTVALARLGEQLQLGETLRLGRGAAKSGARRLTSLHANAFEALIGAIFLDQGYRRAGRVFLSRIGDLSAWTDPNFKGRLQALAQERFGSPPQYRTTIAAGDPRTRQYRSQVFVEGQPQLGEGIGGTKQAAEQAAARAAIDLLVAPVSKKRRRRTASAGATAPMAKESPQLEAAATDRSSVREAPPAALPVAAVVVGVSSLQVGQVVPTTVQPDDSSLTPTPLPAARRRRRRTTRSSVPAVSAVKPGAAENSDPTLGTDQPPQEQIGQISAGPTASRRRRRRTTRPSVAAISEALPGAVENAVSDLAADQTPPEQLGETSAGSTASRRRRRRPARSSAAGVPEGNTVPSVAAPAPVEPPPAPEETVVAAAPEGLTGGPEEGTVARRRTHRGHRGGRRRSGRAATPDP